ncbi:cell division protein ZapA [Ruminococcus gauvreauii]|uniref:Cell division protein ZapA n=1 Tax=Ruminococcus gauvreauii TaxID=438033 RepID=A0ABY5VGF7_9FIRM|nr:cell division protein ZapA [Ruminococcus gauvreauii]UWP59684.1 cell division protein ZapA [Ruminococcus gauvreauii]
MPTKNTTQVLIGGKIIKLSGYESEEYLQKVAAYLNNKIAELGELPGYNRQPVETKSTLLSLNIADDYFKAKKQAEVFEEDSQGKDKEVYDLKHELIAVQIQLENALKELEAVRAEKQSLSQQASKLQSDMEELLK